MLINFLYVHIRFIELVCSASFSLENLVNNSSPSDFIQVGRDISPKTVVIFSPSVWLLYPVADIYLVIYLYKWGEDLNII